MTILDVVVLVMFLSLAWAIVHAWNGPIPHQLMRSCHVYKIGRDITLVVQESATGHLVVDVDSGPDFGIGDTVFIEQPGFGSQMLYIENVAVSPVGGSIRLSLSRTDTLV